LAAPEKHCLKDGCKDGNEYNPKQLDISIERYNKY
jgi:hypothetical protein